MKSPISWKEFSNVFCKEIKIKDSKEIEPLKPILSLILIFSKLFICIS